jgi:acetyl esterase/lipase
MVRLFILAFVVLIASFVFVGLSVRAQSASPERLSLWNGRAPTGEGQFEAAEAWIDVYRPGEPNGTAIVICPGGSYSRLSMDVEGRAVAEWLNRHGMTGIVLQYRLPHHRPYVPLLDAQRAIRMVRMNARTWRLDANRIGIMGFSAGGHLAATAGTHFDKGDAGAADGVERVNSRPDFMILIYPVITMGEKTHKGSRTNLLGPAPPSELIELFSNERWVTAGTPPTFLAHARNDHDVSPENSRTFYKALRAAKISAEYLELPAGGHGLDGQSGPMWEAWQQASLRWLAAIALLVAAKE